MAEVLYVTQAIDGYDIGDIILVKTNGSPWGARELENPLFEIAVIPDGIAKQIDRQNLIDDETGDVVRLSRWRIANGSLRRKRVVSVGNGRNVTDTPVSQVAVEVLARLNRNRGPFRGR